ncbi:MAG: hypothetical protein ACJA2M_002374 [Polaribacter sp.]|jgi:hypothetical protein
MKKIKKAIQLINDLYNTKDGSVGGYGHVVFDDGNLEDGTIKHCINDAEKSKYEDDLCEETRLCSLMALKSFLLLKEYERDFVYERFWDKLN